MLYKNVTHGFPPVIDKDSKILILGSFPSVKSRAENFFYMHPNNRFYAMLEKVYGDNFTERQIATKVKLLKNNHIALYDMVEQCDIVDSKDQEITNVKVTDIPLMIKGTNIEKIILNGKKAYELFLEYYSSLGKKFYYLPSTSSSNARYSLDMLVGIYRKILDD